jgi:2-polyprenyl-3-methyl-5-hydroxy-6-metoxy-1,4-benzoquinol methylase
MDEAKLGAYMGAMAGHMTGASVCFGVWLGDEVGLWRAMAGAGPSGAEAVAAAAGTNPRLTLEWLRGVAAAGLVEYDPAAQTYLLGPEGTLALADETSPVFVARGMATMASMWFDTDKVANAFRGDGKLAWGEHHPHLFTGTEWFFRTGYRALLATEWIPAMDGVESKLAAGGAVADIGCGHGASAIVLAQAYPASRVQGFDYHGESIVTARRRAADEGVADRVSFEVATAKDYAGTYDLICFFDCLHDMGDPVGIAAHAREHLAPGGSVLLVEPFALDGPTNMTENPMAALMYLASTAICTPNSLSQEVGLGLGAQAGPAVLQQVFADAGFSRFDVVASSHLNLIVQVRV